MRILLASIYPYIFLLLFLTIPFDGYVRALPNILLVILAVLFPFVVNKAHFKKLKRISSTVWVIFIVLLALVVTINGNWLEDAAVLKKVGLAGALVLLYLPIDNFKKINKAIIFSSIAAIIFSLIKLFILLNQGQQFTFLESATVIEAILIDRIYLGLLSVLSILASYQLLRSQYHPDNRYYVINIIVNVLFILFIVSRIAIIALLLIFVLSLFHSKKRGPQILFATGSFVLIAVLAFVLNQDLRKKTLYANNIENNGLAANTIAYEPRTIVWDCAYSIVKEEGLSLLGIGFKETNRRMVKCYESTLTDSTQKQFFVNKKYNVHNQFLDFYLGAGLLVFLLFVTAIVVLFFRNRKSFYPSALLVGFVCFAMVENVFYRQIGAYYVGFILLSLLIKNEPHTENKSSLE